MSCLGGDNGHATAYVSGGNLGYAYAWSNGDNTNIADTLSANTYSVVVTDTNGCVVSDSRTLTEPPTALVINGITSNSPLLCQGLDNGTATVSVSGSTPGYSYLWDNANSTIGTYLDPTNIVPSLNDVTPTADTLRAGSYNVQVWDTNGCYVTGSVTITEPSISINIDSIAVDSMDCFNFNNASIQIFTTGPQPAPYWYTLYNASDPTDTIKPLTASPSPQGNIAFSGLGSLHHVVYVQDNLGCIDRDTVIIDPLDSVRIDSVIYSNVSCNGYADGYIEQIFPMGGTPPYQYSIDGGPLYSSWVCTTNVNNCPCGWVFGCLSPGTYTLEIWDANSCSNSYNVTITEPPAMVVNTVTNNYNNYQIACHGGDDEVEFNIIGGLAPYNIAWTDASGQTFNYPTNGQYTWSGLSQGVHDFTITSSNTGSNPGCAQTVSVALVAPPAIQMNPIITDVFCTDSCSGEITAVVSGGVGQGIGTNYTYQWNDASGILPNETSYYIDDRCPGTYTLEVTDANNCTSPFPVTIGDNLLTILPEPTTQVTDVGCYEDCDGSITVAVQGGVPSSTGAASSTCCDTRPA